MENCNHVKVYSKMVLTSLPPQYPWICSLCGLEGKDIGHFDNKPSYDDIKKQFAGKES